MLSFIWIDEIKAWTTQPTFVGKLMAAANRDDWNIVACHIGSRRVYGYRGRFQFFLVKEGYNKTIRSEVGNRCDNRLQGRSKCKQRRNLSPIFPWQSIEEVGGLQTDKSHKYVFLTYWNKSSRDSKLKFHGSMRNPSEMMWSTSKIHIVMLANYCWWLKSS